MPDLSLLRELLPDERTALLITSDVNRRYLSVFPASAGAVVVTKSRLILMVDFRYYEAAQRAVQPPCEVVRCTRLIDDLNHIFLQENINPSVSRTRA